MKILLADKQDIRRAGLTYVIEKMEGLETKCVEDKTELMLALRENEDTVVIVDYTLFDINDSAELLILNQRFPYTRWLLFSEDLSADFVRVLIASSSMFSVTCFEDGWPNSVLKQNKTVIAGRGKLKQKLIEACRFAQCEK